MKRGLNVVDLFCGAGGLSEGFKQAGYNVFVGIDNDALALKTFKRNHPMSEILNKDISKVTKEDILKKTGTSKIDIVIGGPPCQGFSLAGNRDPKDPRNSLIKHYLRLVSQIKPKMFIIENVPGLLSMKAKNGKKVIDIIKKMSKKYGYYLTENLLNSEDYGVPQKRKRVFLVGTKNKKFKLNLKKQSKIPVKEILLEKNKIPDRYFYSKKRIFGFKKREIKNKKLGRGFGWQFLNPNEPSYTISARYYKDGAEALVKYSEKEIRMLTPEECAAIQSFPKDYVFEGGKIQIYKQIGNAVPPKLSLNIARSIKKNM
jgi:DNA (cytosine-5)-methyltransferase 1